MINQTQPTKCICKFNKCDSKNHDFPLPSSIYIYIYDVLSIGIGMVVFRVAQTLVKQAAGNTPKTQNTNQNTNLHGLNLITSTLHLLFISSTNSGLILPDRI